jgi:serine/threonine protein kinase/Tol biopolymer transport system component
MGVVFEAEDLTLGRRVALKFLPEGIGDDALALERFRREALILSSLNHPHICTVYEIGEHEQRRFIAMELMEGEPLKQRISSAVREIENRPAGQPVAYWPLAMDHIMDWSVQLADALDAAHAKGVVHRDIKPGNIFITTRGYAKILDFGLAKTAVSETAETEFGQLTNPGAAVGTLIYMSPEQALGRDLDARTDLFSLGVVMYEMTTGKHPFLGPTTAAIFDNILHKTPDRASAFNPEIPAKLEEIVFKCLEKDPQLRYQSAAELCADLRRARRDTGAISVASATAVVAPVRTWTRSAWAGVAVLALVSLLLLWKLSSRSGPSRTLEPMLQRLTSDSGLILFPAISRDAKLLAYASDRSGDGNLDIWVRQVGGGDPIRLTRDPADDDEPDFSPDATQIAFHSGREGGGLYVVPALGGQERRLADGGRRPRFSPSGKQIAYWSGEPYRAVPSLPRSAAIYIIDAGGGQPRRWQQEFDIATRPLWTPDGSHILFWGTKQRLATRAAWWVAPVDGGPAVEVTAAGESGSEILERSEACGWRNDSVVFSMRHENNLLNVYEAPFSFTAWRIIGAPHRLTFGTTLEESPSVAADGSFVFSSVAANAGVYTVGVNADRGEVSAPLERRTSSLAEDTEGTLSSDGRKLTFQSLRSGQSEIWISHLESGKEQALARGAYPILSPDGVLIAYTHDGKAMIIPSEGGGSRQLSSRHLDPSDWSPDQSLLMAADYSKPRTSIELIDVASGNASEYLTHPQRNLYPRGFSRDGRWISFSMASPTGQVLMVAPFRVAAPPKEEEWIAVTDPLTNDFNPRWSPNGQLLYFISEREGFACIWARRLDANTKKPVGDPFPVLHLHRASLRMRPAERILSVAKDKLAFTLEERAGSIWLLQFK